MKSSEMTFSLRNVSVIFVTAACSLSLSNCDNQLAANSVNLRDLISWCDCLYTHTVLNRGTVGCVWWCCEQVTLCFGTVAWIWKVRSNDMAECIRTDTRIIQNSRVYCTSEDISWTVCVLLCSWTCSSSFFLITVSTVQLQTVQFVQYLYTQHALQYDTQHNSHSVSLCEQQSAAIYNHCVTVWVSSG